MKLNSTLLLTFLLLLMMVGAGSASGFWGYTIGRQALKGVGQPDVNPTQKLTGNQATDHQHKGLEIVSEREILVKAYDQTHGKGKDDPDETSNQTTASKPKSETTPKQGDSDQEFIKNKQKLVNFPINGKDQDITLEVINYTQDSASLVLDVNLKNDGRKAVKFLYSFLEVKDNEGKTLSAITDGLPGELPANGEKYAGNIRIPLVLLDDAKSISLSLTDYPDQKLKLNIAKIPVTNPESNP